MSSSLQEIEVSNSTGLPSTVTISKPPTDQAKVSSSNPSVLPMGSTDKHAPYAWQATSPKNLPQVYQSVGLGAVNSTIIERMLGKVPRGIVRDRLTIDQPDTG